MATEASKPADLDTLKADLADLRAEVGKLADHLSEAVRGKVEEGKGRARGKVKEARAEAERMASDVYEQHREQLDAVAEQVRDRPITSMLAAFGLGLLVARLLGRS